MSAGEESLPLYVLKANPDNKLCFDCPAENVTHVVLDFTTFVCRDCAKMHTDAGREVKSMMSTFTKEQVQQIESGGNLVALIVHLCNFEGTDITPFTTPDEIKRFMDEKYVQRKWYNGELEAAAREAQLADNKAFLISEAAEANSARAAAANENSQANQQKVIYGVAKGNPVGRTRAFNQVTRQRSESLSKKTAAFIVAADNGNLAEVEQMLDGGISADIQNESKVCALHRASAKGHVHVVKLLIARGANLDLRDKWLDTALHKACHNGNTPVVKALIAANANVNLKNTEDRTPVMVCKTPALATIVREAGGVSTAAVDAASKSGSKIDQKFPRARQRGRSFTMQDGQRRAAVRDAHLASVAEDNPFGGFQAKVLYDFRAEYKNELDVYVGQVIDVIDEHPPAGQGWWLCGRGGAKGLVPASYVQIIKESVVARGPGAHAGMPSNRDKRLSSGSYAAAWTQSRPAPKPANAVELFNAVAQGEGGGLIAAPPTASRRRANSLRRPTAPMAGVGQGRRSSVAVISETREAPGDIFGAMMAGQPAQPAAQPAAQPPKTGGGSLLDMDWTGLSVDPTPVAPAAAPPPAQQGGGGGGLDIFSLGAAPQQVPGPAPTTSAAPSMNDLMKQQQHQPPPQQQQHQQHAQQNANPFF